MEDILSPAANVAGGWAAAQKGTRSEKRRLFIVYKEAQTQRSNSEGRSLHQGHSGCEIVKNSPAACP